MMRKESKRDKMGAPLDTAPPLLYSRPHRNSPWRGLTPPPPSSQLAVAGFTPRHAEKSFKTVNVLFRNRVYGGRGPRPARIAFFIYASLTELA